MSENAHSIERGELRMLSLSWSREAFDNAAQFWLESSQRWAPWFFLPSLFTRPFELLQELTSHALSQQEELTRSVLQGLPGGPDAAPELEAPGRGALEALRQTEQERDEARADLATAERALAAARAERDEALRALRAAEVDAEKARGEVDAARAQAAATKAHKPGASSPRARPSSSD